MFLFCPFHSDDAFCALLPEVKAEISSFALKNKPAPDPMTPITDSRPKWAEYIAVYRPKQPKYHTLWGGTYLYGLYKGVPPPPPRIC